MAPNGVGIQMCYRRVCHSTAGDWGSNNPVLALSLRRCRTTAYTSSTVPRFPTMLLSPRPFGSRLGGRLGVIDPELRPPLVAIPSVRDTAHAFMVYGLVPAVYLRARMKRFFPFRQLHSAFPVDSLRVRWVPLVQSFRRLGAFAMSPHPRVDSVPVLRLLCPIRLSPQVSSFRETLPSHYFPTALGIPRGVSRVHRGGLQRDEVGGVLLCVPSALCGSPGLSEDTQVDLCPLLRCFACPPHRALLPNETPS